MNIRKEMTEIEIKNFAHDFINLINHKDIEINNLKDEIDRLKEQLKSLNPTKMTSKEVATSKRPVWVITKDYKHEFYALPISNGVMSVEGGRYYMDNYEKTWIAYSDRPLN